MLVRIVVAIVFVLGLAACSVSESQLTAKIDAQAKQIAEIQARVTALQTDLKKTGRFQVMNGTPQLARNIMLVDTETGRVWLVCETKGVQSETTTNWCAMDFYGTAANP